MNTKKITALALAALMAAGSTATAFAEAQDKDKALVFNGVVAYEEDDNSVLVEDKDGVAPGDSIYFLLKEGANNGKPITEKELDRMNVYADWKRGKDCIKDIDIIYKKGNEIKAVSVGGVKIEAANVAGLNAAVLKAYKGNNSSVVSAVDGKFEEKSAGFTLNGEYIQNIDGLLAKLNYTQKKNFKYDSNYYIDSEAGLIAVLEKEGFVKADASKQYGSTANAANGLGTDLVTDGSGTAMDAAKLYVKEAESKFVDLSKVADLSAFETKNGDTTLFGTDKVSENTNGYQKGEKAFAGKTEAEASAKAEQGVAVVDGSHMVYVDKTANTTVIADSKDKAVDWAIAKIIKAENLADSNAYTYWVKIDTKESTTTKEQDIVGTLSLGTTKNGAEKANNEISISLPLSNRVYDDNNNFVAVEDEHTIYPDANGAVKFSDDAEEVTIYFGDNEEAWFTFNAKGQGALNLAYTTKFNKEIADLFPKANIDFISWIAEPAANRTGDLYITANEDTFLYQVTDDGKGVKEVKGAKYLEDEGAWHLRTRELGSYVISDMELDTTAKVEDKDEASSNSSTSSKPNGDKHNPDTGR